MVFWWKNLDLGSNLYKLIKLINNKNNPNRPYSWTLPLRSAQTPRLLAHQGTLRPEFFFAESFYPRSIYPESEKKLKKFSKIFFLPPHPYQYEDHLEPSMPHIRGINR